MTTPDIPQIPKLPTTPPATPTPPGNVKPPKGDKAQAGKTPAQAAKVPYKQPPFDPRIYNFKTMVAGSAGSGFDDNVSPSGPSQLSRGFIRQANPVPGYKDVAYLYFLYNPSEVSANYAIQMEAAAALQYPNPGDTGTPILPINQTVDFSLLFDRTFELWDKKYLNLEVGQKGVEVDIQAIKQLVGMTVTLDNAAPQSTGADANGGAAGGASGSFVQAESMDVMRAVQCWVHIGGRKALTYFGYITNWGVNYTHWSQYMVPMRAVVNVSFQLLPSATSKGPVPSAKNNVAGLSTSGTGTGKGTGATPSPVSPANKAGR